METSPDSNLHPIDVVSLAVKGYRGIAKLMLKDLEALPEGAFTNPFGPKTRTVADIVYEVNLVNDHIGMVIRGEKPFDWPEGGWIKAPEDLDSKQAVVEAFRVSSDRFGETAESFSGAALCEPFDTGEAVTTRLERIRFATVHMWYHSGQLNYIQTLIGDDVWHWNS